MCVLTLFSPPPSVEILYPVGYYSRYQDKLSLWVFLDSPSLYASSDYCQSRGLEKHPTTTKRDKVGLNFASPFVKLPTTPSFLHILSPTLIQRGTVLQNALVILHNAFLPIHAL